MKGRMTGGEEGVEGEEGGGGSGGRMREGREKDGKGGEEEGETGGGRDGEEWGYLGENCYIIRILFFYKFPKTTTVSIVILISPSAVHY